MSTLILRLDIAGQPIGWLSREQCALLYCREQVAWEAGTETVRLHGGTSRLTGQQSILDVNSIIATRSTNRHSLLFSDIPALSNTRLFRRDECMCVYCGETFPPKLLTRDHVTPISRGGKDIWENVVSSCQPCNHRKGHHLPAEIHMELLAIPYAPNKAEGLILTNRRILADQMQFLRSRVGKNSRMR